MSERPIIIDGLREHQRYGDDLTRLLCERAADEIERLRAENARLHQAADALATEAAAAKVAAIIERKACAKIADENTDFRMMQDFGMQTMCDQLCANIASAIRARGTP